MDKQNKCAALSKNIVPINMVPTLNIIPIANIFPNLNAQDRLSPIYE